MRHVWWLVVTMLVPRALIAQTPSAAFESPELLGYVRQVLEGNAAYRAAGSRLAAATERIATAGALPDPIFTTGVVATPVPSFSFTAERMTRVSIGIRQSFPFPGKLGAATAVARADSARGSEIVGAVEADLVAAAVGAYYALAHAGTALQVWQARQTLADQAVQVAQARYETGAVPLTDLLRARLRRAELEEKRRQLEADLVAARARLDALRGGRADTVVPQPLLRADGGAALVVWDDSLVPDTTLLQRLAMTSPALLVAAAEVERAGRRARVFAIAARPDFTVSLDNGIRFGGREPFLTVLVGISVPLWAGRKQAPAARAARLDVDDARQRYDDLLARLTGEVVSSVAALEALQSRIQQTHGEIIPLAGAASTSALQRYRVGAVSFTTVLDTQDDLFDAQLRLARLIADYGAARARLAALVGEEWYR